MISCVTICRKEDTEQMHGILQTLPKGSEWIRVLTVYSETLSNNLELPKQEIEGITVRDITHYYKDFRFDTAKNVGIEKASNDWVLILDSDERLVLPEAIEGTIEMLDSNNVGGFYCKVMSPIENLGMKIQTSKQVRLFKKQFRYNLRIHEQVEFNIKNAGFEIIDTAIPIFHYGYGIDDVEHWKVKYKRNVSLMNYALANDKLSKEEANLLHSKLGLTYVEIAKHGGLDFEFNGKFTTKTIDLL
jgi:glycosyltransferase involved in cell wall biosynthesis